jgi:hypothetical protein
MKIKDIELAINYPERFRSVCLRYHTVDFSLPRPKKDDLLPIFKKLGVLVKYYSIDRIYIDKSQVGNYSFEYYFEFDGTHPWVFLYIKKIGGEWPLQRYTPGLANLKMRYPKEKEDQLEGYSIFTINLYEIESALSELKPLLDDLRNAVIPYLEKDELDFNVD